LPLRDIHLPEGIGWWPPAPGWWLLLTLVVVATVLAWWWQRRYRARRANRAVLKLLDDAAAQAATQPLLAVQTVSLALRRFVITTQRQGPGAAVTDDAWLTLLDSRWDQDSFSHGQGRILAAAPYMPAERVEADTAVALVELARQWMNVQQPAGT
jgi:cytoskeletal protein RodZ